MQKDAFDTWVEHLMVRIGQFLLNTWRSIRGRPSVYERLDYAACLQRIERLERELEIGRPTRQERFEAIARRIAKAQDDGFQLEVMSEFLPADLVVRAREINAQRQRRLAAEATHLLMRGPDA